MHRPLGFFLLVFAILPATLPGQLLTFSSLYGNGYHPVAVQEELAGYYTIAFDPPALCFTDAAATPLTFNRLPHTGIERIVGLLPSVNGGHYLAGHGANGLFLMEAGLSMFPLWFRTYGGGTAKSVEATPDGGFILCGENTGSHKVFLVKTNSVGVLEWSREVDLENGDEIPAGATRLKFGTYVVAGSLLRTGQVNRLSFLVQFDNGGNMLRTAVLQTGNPTLPLSISPTSTGGFLLGGYSVAGGEERAIVARFDSVLQPLWIRTLMPDSIGRVHQVVEGNGRFNSVSTIEVGGDSLEKRIVAAQWDELGNLTYAARIGQEGINLPLQITADLGAIHVCGELPSSTTFQGFLHKFIPNFADQCVDSEPFLLTDTVPFLLDTLAYTVQPGPSYVVDSVPSLQPFSIFSTLACSSVAVEEASALGWKVYPNPASGSFKLQIPTGIRDASLRLVDLRGREIWRARIEHGQFGGNFPLPAGGDGIYFLEIVSEKGRLVEKILNQP